MNSGFVKKPRLRRPMRQRKPRRKPSEAEVRKRRGRSRCAQKASFAAPATEKMIFLRLDRGRKAPLDKKVNVCDGSPRPAPWSMVVVVAPATVVRQVVLHPHRQAWQAEAVRYFASVWNVDVARHVFRLATESSLRVCCYGPSLGRVSSAGECGIDSAVVENRRGYRGGQRESGP